MWLRSGFGMLDAESMPSGLAGWLVGATVVGGAVGVGWLGLRSIAESRTRGPHVDVLGRPGRQRVRVEPAGRRDRAVVTRRRHRIAWYGEERREKKKKRGEKKRKKKKEERVRERQRQREREAKRTRTASP